MTEPRTATVCECGGRCHHEPSPCSLGCWAAQKPWRVEEAFEAGRARAGTLDVERVTALRDVILNGGLRLPDFDHWRERASSKPSDPDDVRWDCVCGYSGSPEQVWQHWRAILAAPSPAVRKASDD